MKLFTQKKGDMALITDLILGLLMFGVVILLLMMVSVDKKTRNLEFEEKLNEIEGTKQLIRFLKQEPYINNTNSDLLREAMKKGEIKNSEFEKQSTEYFNKQYSQKWCLTIEKKEMKLQKIANDCHKIIGEIYVQTENKEKIHLTLYRGRTEEEFVKAIESSAGVAVKRFR